jgi:ankyrin repeat protein
VETALQAAVIENHEGMAKLLLAHGADINLVGGKYGTPLQDAATRGRIGLLELLIDKGADVNVEGGKYGTALQAACTTVLLQN